MGRWFARLRELEENAETLGEGTDKNPKNPPEPAGPVFLGFLGVGHPGVSENFGPDAADLDAEYEERAGILEYDGGLSRPEAEGLAREHVANVVTFRGRR